MKYKSYIKYLLLLILVITGVFVLLNIINKKNSISKEKTHIVLVIKAIDPSFNFWQIIKAGAETAKEEFNISMEIVGPKNENDIDEQIKILNDVIEKKPSVIILAATDYYKLVPVAQKIKSKKIPIITVDSGINSEIPASLIATDNFLAGEKAGEKMGQLLSENDKIIIISYVKGTNSAIEREKGVRKAIEKNYIIIEEVYYCDNFRDKAYEMTLNILKNKPDIKGIIALNDPSTTGVARAIKKSGNKSKIKLVGFDNGTEEIEFLEEGVISALIVQKPFNMGYLSVTTALDLLKGKHVTKKIDTGSNLITLDNMYSMENQKLLFPLIKEIPIK